MISSEQDFEAFKESCLEDVASLQDEFKKLYDLESYEHWFYDNNFGAFHFKSECGKNHYFKYVKVGSFSTKANTWMWSWHNSSIPTHISKPLEKVRSFGSERNYNELTEGLFNADEYTGWAMTAISSKLLSAIGSYRIEEDGLFSYFIFTNELTRAEFDGLKDKYVICNSHVSDRVAFICQHLNKDNYTGFHEAFDADTITDENDGYEAWCDECENIRLIEGEWNDKSMAFAKIRIVCDQCYFEIKERNQTTE